MNSKDGNAGGLQILRCQGFEVKYYDFTLDALTLKPSDVCNVRVNATVIFDIFTFERPVPIVWIKWRLTALIPPVLLVVADL